MKTNELKPNPHNPRQISDTAFAKLCESIKRDPEFLDLRPIVYDEDGTVIGGNMRLRAINHLGMKEIPDTWAVKAADLTDEQKRRFILVDNAPEGMAGTWDIDLLANEFEVPELKELGFDLEGMGGKRGGDNPYTGKIVLPIYEPKGECPPVSELFDHEKTSRLMDEVDNAGLSEDVTRFLKLAAERHTAFHFRKIAEFYCHADEQVQELMEKSGLVIIDFDKAIEYGFVYMTEKLGKLADMEKSELDFDMDNNDA